MPNKKRSYAIPGQSLKIAPAVNQNNGGTDKAAGHTGPETAAPASRELILRLIEWIKQV